MGVQVPTRVSTKTHKPMRLSAVLSGVLLKMKGPPCKSIVVKKKKKDSSGTAPSKTTTKVYNDLPEDATAHILSFLPLQQVVRLRTLSKHFAQAGHLAVLEKLQMAGFTNITCPSDALLKLTQPHQKVRNWMHAEYKGVANSNINYNKNYGGAVEVLQFPIVHDTELWDRMGPLLNRPRLHEKYLWMLPDRNNNGQEQAVGVDLRSSCFRVCVSIKQCLQEYRATLEETATLFSDWHFRAVDIMLRKEVETLLALQSQGHEMACVAFVSKPSTSEALEGSIYQTVVDAMEEPLMKQAIRIRGRNTEENSSPCFLDLARVGIVIRVPCAEHQSLFQKFDTMVKEHSRQEVANLLNM
ncbi:expressed unknown protein [Seminavis robusta]|uniref:F-box domain-containing protein n=1 Tax=Seminavis robusta TaxID=568900 RepID=A0A9N8DVX6_9STRA|nr:expressed unknown protein [Seminavis robusta]|eukprot:Sro396_g134340.1 n/a (355) ;mRNA; f:49839-50903